MVKSAPPPRNPALESKIWRAKVALVAEAAWLRLWILFAVLAAFLIVSLAGIWPLLPPIPHFALLGLFAAGLLAWLVATARIPWPSREDAIRRIERISGIPHRPASSYEDTLSSSEGNPETQALWRAHRARMAELLNALRPGHPEPRTHRFDPLALRALLPFAVVVALGFAGPNGFARMSEAFDVESPSPLANARLDAWITPPVYTGRSPVMLADGGSRSAGTSGEKTTATPASGSTLEVPEASVVVVRLAGGGAVPLALELVPEAEPTGSSRIDAVPSAAGSTDVLEARATLEKSARLKIVSGNDVLREWQVSIIPDNLPGIALTKNPEVTERGAMKLTYFVQDDYGVASAEVTFEPLPVEDAGDPLTAWARPAPPTGPRPPYSRPPKLELRLPQPYAKQGEAFTYHELGSHPFAGRKVSMTLRAKDVAGKTGQSHPIEIVLPERQFKKPLARAVIEQRRLLLEDPRYATRVATALDALTIEPDGFVDDPRVYLALRAAHYRLGRDTSRAGTDSVIDQLWHTALRIEDGDLSDAERNLRDIQDRLAKALEEGASDEEIQRLMKELREAFNEYARELAEKAGQEPSEQQEGENSEQLSSEDLDRMLKQMEDLAKSGLREQAKDMLAQMRDLMERMQSAQQSREQRERNAEAEKMMRRLGEAAGEQQNLMDDTFDQRRKNSGQGQGQLKQNGQAGQRGQRGQGGVQADRNGPQGFGDGQGEMQLGERGRDGSGPEGGRGKGDKAGLGERQRELRERLEALRREMQEKGFGDGERLGEAAEAMRDAEEAIASEDFEQANQDQGRALDSMREGGEELAGQMQQPGGQQRYGENGDSPRDPLGRPQRSQGPDQGRSVKVPDEIDMQRAREVLEELRRRLGEATRPEVELQYLERLMRWY